MMEDIKHEPSLTPPEPKDYMVLGHCVCCGEPIYEGDTWYDLGEEMWCEDCVSSSRRYG